MTTVLLADDQLDMCAIHTDYLRRHGFRVVSVADGIAALKAASTEHPDIIVLDHSMPGRTGIDVARELKSNPATASIPILLMTAHAYGAIGQRALAAGCAAFLAKPCGPRRVLQEVVRHLPQQRATAPEN